MSCAHCLELQLKLEELREEIASTRARRLDDAYLFAERFKISRHPSIVLATLYARQGDFVTSQLLDEALPAPAHGNVRSRNHITLYVFALRMALGDDVIENQYGLGWRLTHKGQALCKAALEARQGRAA